ncbi:hypothetical protein J3F83DRAFT_744734 [Trichoderma novae-zelandiae]
MVLSFVFFFALFVSRRSSSAASNTACRLIPPVFEGGEERVLDCSFRSTTQQRQATLACWFDQIRLPFFCSRVSCGLSACVSNLAILRTHTYTHAHAHTPLPLPLPLHLVCVCSTDLPDLSVFSLSAFFSQPTSYSVHARRAWLVAPYLAPRQERRNSNRILFFSSYRPSKKG